MIKRTPIIVSLPDSVGTQHGYVVDISQPWYLNGCVMGAASTSAQKHSIYKVLKAMGVR